MATCIKVVMDARQPARSQYTRDPQGKSQPQLTNTETWTVVFDGYVEATDVYAASAGGNTLPQVGTVYNGLFCDRVNPVRDSGSPFVWRVTVDYVNIQIEQQQGTNWNINLRIGSVARQEVQMIDGLGKPYFNAAGELLPQLPQADLYDRTYTVTWQTSTPPPWANTIYEGKVNEDTVTFTIAGISVTWQPFQAKCAGCPINCTRTTVGTDSGGNPIYTTTYDCELSFQVRSFMYNGNELGWVWTAPNEGYKGYDYSDETTFGTFLDDGHVTPLASGVTSKAGKRTDPTKLDVNGCDLNQTSGPNTPVLILPMDMVGAGTNYSDYGDAGRFVPFKAVAMSSLFNGLSD